jgi:hypothetical protein
MRRWVSIVVVAVLAVAGLAGTVIASRHSARALAVDAGGPGDFQFSTGFSSVQGQDQWSYLTWNGSAYTPMSWDAANSRWQGSCQWCLIGRGWVHPDAKDTVIGWKAPRSGTVTVRGSMDHRGDSARGDGVRTVIKKQSGTAVTKIWPSADYQVIRPNFVAQHVLKVDVAAGDLLYFHVNLNTTTDYDSLQWDPRISYGYEPKFTLDAAELVMTPDDFQRVGITPAQDSSMSVVPNGAGFDFYHSGNGTTLAKFHGTLAQPAQQPVYAKNIFNTNPATDEEWWVINTYQASNGRLLAFCHIENSPTTTGGWGLGLAYSTDGGTTFSKLGKIVTETPTAPGANINGIPYVVRDGYFYVYYVESNNQPAVARAPVSEVLAAAANHTVSAWHKYSAGGWAEPGIGGQASPILADGVLFGMHGDAAYSTYLGKYLIASNTGHLGRGVFLTFSDDAVNYEVPSWLQSSTVSTKDYLSPYETIVAADGSDNGVVGQSFYVYFSYRFKWTTAPGDQWPALWRWLYRQKVTLNRAGFDRNRYDASTDFTTWVGGNNWGYAAASGLGLVPGMGWDGNLFRWNGPAANLYEDAGTSHPDGGYDAARVWTAPASGQVQVSAPDGISVGTGPGADGVGVRIGGDRGQLWPASGYQPVSAGTTIGFAPLTLTVAKGQHLYFYVNQNGNSDGDTVSWRPVVEYVGDSRIMYNSWPDFTGTQGLNQWYYLEWDGSSYTQLSWDPANQRYQGSAFYLLVAPETAHPDAGHDAVRAWVAPRDGTVSITSVLGDITVANGTGADGVKVKVMKGGGNVWPASGYQLIPPGGSQPFDAIRVGVVKGDTLYFQLNQNGGTAYDTTVWVPAVAYIS